MPGIFGLVRKPGGHDERPDQECRLLVDAMAAAMQYETFYVCHRYESPRVGIWTGWVGAAETVDTRAPAASRFARVSLLTAGEPRIADGTRAHATGGSETARMIDLYTRTPNAFP